MFPDADMRGSVTHHTGNTFASLISSKKQKKKPKTKQTELDSKVN